MYLVRLRNRRAMPCRCSTLRLMASMDGSVGCGGTVEIRQYVAGAAFQGPAQRFRTEYD